MKYNKALFVLAIAVSLGLCEFAAQAKMHRPAHKKVTVTGCLQKGDEPNEYTISGKDNVAYDLEGTASLSLKDHVGHKVTVTGASVTKMKSEEEKKEPVRGHLQVTHLVMVSTTCP